MTYQPPVERHSQGSQAKLLKDGRPFVELVLERKPSIRLLLGNGPHGGSRVRASILSPIRELWTD